MAELAYQIAMVVGVPRSGTTLLQVILASHPGIVTARETHLFDRYLGPLLDRYRNEPEDFKCADGIRAHINRETLNAHFRSIALSVLSAMHARAPAAEVVLEKTPGHLGRLAMIDLCLPEAKFIHIVRDPRGVAASMKAASSEGWGAWADKDPSKLARKWLHSITTASITAQRLLGSRYRQVRYEDLFIAGGAVVNDLYAWLGLAPDETLPDDLSERFPIAGMARDGGDPADPRSETRPHFFRRGDPESWREELSPSEIAAIESVCAECMAALGYLPTAGQGASAA